MSKLPFTRIWGIILLVFAGLSLQAQIDLELSMVGNPLVPEAFKNYTFSLTVTNQGPQSASNVQIDLPLPPGFTYQGGNAYSASQGEYDIFFQRTWNVGTLSPNANATIDLNLYSLQSTDLFCYGQVIAADQTDSDSSPDNGGCPSDPSNCSVQEDDEALVLLSNSGACSLDATVISRTCLDPNNSPDPLDDRWSFEVLVNATNAPSAGWTTFSQGLNGATGTYGQNQSLGDFLISDGAIDITLQDQQNAGCFQTINVAPPLPCSNSNCSIEVVTTTPICSDSGTPNDPTDDGFQFILVANGINTTSTQYRAQITNASTFDNLIVNYGADLLISKFIGDGLVEIIISDLIDPNCSRTLVINPTAPCSTPVGTAPDLELSWSTSNPNPNIYTTADFKLRLQNTGSLPVDNVQISIPLVSDLAYVGHVAEAGIYSNWLGLWDIGTVAAGQQIDLDVSLFTLSSERIDLYAQVQTQALTDLDSSPGNGQCCTANEDDEAVLVLNNGSGPLPCTLNALNPQVTCEDNGTADPNDDRFSFSINPGGSNLSSTFRIEGGGLATADLPYGQSYTSPLLPISAGEFNLQVVDASGNCSQNVNIIPPPPCSNSGPAPGVDLALTMSSEQLEFSAWEIIAITVMVENQGSEMANNVFVSFPLPEGVVFTGGNESVASQGSYELFFEEWNVGSLAAGAVAMIQFNLFTTQADNTIDAYAQVVGMTENDTDSTPGNGSCCTANEDDEAVLQLTPLSNRFGAAEEAASRLAIRQLYPNPAVNDLQVVIEALEATEDHIRIYDSRGQLQREERVTLRAGMNWYTIALEEMGPGIYWLQLVNAQGKFAWQKFIVQNR